MCSLHFLFYPTLKQCIKQYFLIADRVTINLNHFGSSFYTYQPLVDQSIDYGSSYHLAFAIPALFIFLAFNVLPPIMLICYPIKAFRSCLSRCHLNFVAVYIFINRVHSCYRNGLDDGRDMRSLSVLYLFLRFIAGLSLQFSHLANRYSNVYIDKWFFLGIFFSIISLSMAFIRPYDKAHMNYLDAFLLLLCV